MGMNINLKTACNLKAEIDKKCKFILAHSQDEWYIERIGEQMKEMREKEKQLAQDKNYLKLWETLYEVQKRSQVRTVDNSDVIDSLNQISDNLAISKKAMDGVTVKIDPNAQKFPSAYKGFPQSTIVHAEYKNGGWRVTKIARERTQTKRFLITLTDEAKEALIKRFEIME